MTYTPTEGLQQCDPFVIYSYGEKIPAFHASIVPPYNSIVHVGFG